MRLRKSAIFYATATALCLTLNVVFAQQGPGVGPLQGGPLLDNRGIGLRQPPPQDRGPVARLMAGCTFYEHVHLQGQSVAYRQLLGVKPGDLTREVPYVGDAMNDRISSFRCDNLCRAIVYSDANFQGDVARDYNQAPDMNDVAGATRQGFNDVVSSLKVVCRVY